MLLGTLHELARRGSRPSSGGRRRETPVSLSATRQIAPGRGVPGGMKWSPCIALALCTLGAGVSRASADSGPFRSGAVAWEDTNSDGVVTPNEVRAAALRLFVRFDRDGDGVVTRAEARAARPGPSRARVEARFGDLDHDRDGWLSRRESRLSPRRFTAADQDADGRLSSAELWRARGGASGGDALRALLWRRDLDGDGRVTRAEAERAAEVRFRRRDRDGDGLLTPRDGRRRQPLTDELPCGRR